MVYGRYRCTEKLLRCWRLGDGVIVTIVVFILMRGGVGWETEVVRPRH